MGRKITTRFSREASTWYDKWLEKNTYHIDPPDVEITRIPIIGMKHLGLSDDIALDGPVVLEADPENRFDSKAVKVLYCDEQIGWVPRRQTALIHSKDFNQEGEVSVLPKVISGTEPFIYVIDKV